MLSNWLMYLGVDEKTAAEDACRIEHVVSAKSFQAIKDHVTKGNELLENRKTGGPERNLFSADRLFFCFCFAFT